VVAGLRDRDPVERSVQLSVAAAVKAMSLRSTRTGLEQCHAGVSCELGVGLEASDRSDLGERLGGGDGGAAGQFEECRGDLLRPLLEFLVELGDRAGSAAHALQMPGAAKHPQGHPVRPAGQLGAADLDHLLAERPTGFVDSDRGHGVLVNVKSDHDHLDRLLCRRGRPASGQTSN
jgi:hypothetical protein